MAMQNVSVALLSFVSIFTWSWGAYLISRRYLMATAQAELRSSVCAPRPLLKLIVPRPATVQTEMEATTAVTKK